MHIATETTHGSPVGATTSAVHDVVVVGAGLSGLVAADALHGRGRAVVVLEAKNRLGGRLLSHALLGGGVVDAGGSWVGPVQPTVLALARELGLETADHHDEGLHLLTLRGRTRSYRGSVPPLPPPALADLALALWRLDRLVRSVPATRPWEAPHATRLDRTTLGHWMGRHVPTHPARVILAAACSASFGCRPQDLSLWGFATHVAAAGGLEAMTSVDGGALERRIVGGAQQLCERLAARLPGRVLLGEAVESVSRAAPDAATVATATRRFHARRVVVATDPVLASVLRHDPPLPPRRREFERRYRMGQGIKVHVVYERPFWRQHGLSGQSTADAGAVRGTFDVSPADGEAGVLMTFLDADGVDRDDLHDPSAAGVRRDLLVRELAGRFGPAATRPLDHLETDWGSEPFQSGCVPAPAPGVLTAARDAVTAPVGRLHWAGAESSPVWEGHMEGAVLAGRRAADEVDRALTDEGRPPSGAAGARA